MGESSRVRRGQNWDKDSHLIATFFSKLCLPILSLAPSQAGWLGSQWSGCPGISNTSQLAKVYAYLSHAFPLSTCCLLSQGLGIPWELMEGPCNWGTSVPRLWDGKQCEAPWASNCIPQSTRTEAVGGGTRLDHCLLPACPLPQGKQTFMHVDISVSIINTFLAFLHWLWPLTWC